MCRDPDKDLTGEEHGDDLSIDGEVSMLDHVKEQLKERFLVKSANITSLMLGYERQGHVLKRTVSVNQCGWHLEHGERYAEQVWHGTSEISCDPWKQGYVLDTTTIIAGEDEATIYETR